MSNEINTIPSATVLKVSNEGTFSWSDQDHQKYLCTLSVPGRGTPMDLEVVLWNKPGAPCPLQEGEVQNIQYKTKERDGIVTYQWVNPASQQRRGGSGGGRSFGPRVGLEIAKQVGDTMLKATWLGEKDKVPAGIADIKTALAQLESSQLNGPNF